MIICQVFLSFTWLQACMKIHIHSSHSTIQLVHLQWKKAHVLATLWVTPPCSAAPFNFGILFLKCVIYRHWPYCSCNQVRRFLASCVSQRHWNSDILLHICGTECNSGILVHICGTENMPNVVRYKIYCERHRW